MTPAVIYRVSCRACGGHLDDLTSLGPLYLSTFLKEGQPEPVRVPIDVMICRQCDLVQLRHTVDADALYRQYWYLSGVNESMRDELHDITARAQALVPLQEHDVVMDIGANDGTLLASYPSDVYTIAFEPAKNLFEELRPKVHALFADYFPRGLKVQANAKIITAIAMFYDLEDPHGFLDAIEAHLADDGLCILQFQDLLNMVEQNAYDNLVHEHLVYYRVKDIDHLLRERDHRLQIVDVEQRAINGGSVRIYLRKGLANLASPRVAEQFERERVLTYDRLRSFVWGMEDQRRQLRAAVEMCHATGKTIDLYGASTKANTLLQFCGLGRADIRWAVERSPAKYGLRMVGSDVPIVDEHTWRSRPADVTLAGIWQHRDAILKREEWYLGGGGVWLFPLPNVEVVRGSQLSTLR